MQRNAESGTRREYFVSEKTFKKLNVSASAMMNDFIVFRTLVQILVPVCGFAMKMKRGDRRSSIDE